MLTRLQKKKFEQKKNIEYYEKQTFAIGDINHVLKTHYPKDINMSFKPHINTVDIKPKPKPKPIYSELLVYKDFNYHRNQGN